MGNASYRRVVEARRASNRAVRRVTGRFVPVGEVRVGDEVNIGTLSDIPDEDGYYTVTKVQRHDNMVYVWVDIIDPASEDEDVYYVVPQSTEVEVTSDHLARRRASRENEPEFFALGEEWGYEIDYDGWDDSGNPSLTVVLLENGSVVDALGGVEVDFEVSDHGNINMARIDEEYLRSLALEMYRDYYGTSYKRAVRKRAERQAIKGIAIYPDKRVEEVTVAGLKDMQAIVKGLIEPVGLSDGSTLYVNEEGLYLFGPEDFNSIATDVAGLGGARQILLSGIMGPALLVGPVSEDGYDTDVTAAGRSWVNRVSREASKRRASRRRNAASNKLLSELPGYRDTCGCSLMEGRCDRHAEMLRWLHSAYWNSTPNSEMRQEIYALSDGYGTPGFVPSQGFDWSGIRDSSTAAIEAMYAATTLGHGKLLSRRRYR